MEISELTLWIARLGVILLMYLLVVVLILAIRADARAASESPALPLHPSPRPAPPATPIPAPSVHKLLVTSGTMPLCGREIQLFGTMDIGRNAGSAISIPSHFVSTRHARLLMQNGRWQLEDLSSTNGTLLNEQMLVGMHALQPGDIFRIGDTEFLVQ